ncbi:DNA ligase/mRNA capping enzyme, partial [Fomitiporia mediterranea MF3/22]|uniref:DNA ligase/mRNA capping enzyme n=1 Tax=Fomitiporia mediterranea (strain MF3/22) TaxID=694068 RepID=UPI0004407AD1
FRRWVQELRKRFPRPPPDTTKMIFLMLFPEEDVRRKYGMQEVMLARVLDGVLSVNGSLKRWASSCDTCTSSLGEEVCRVMSCSATEDDGNYNTVTIQEVNSMLDELAAKSRFSACELRDPAAKSDRSRQTILQSVFRKLRPFEAAVLTQIILKDLRPVIYPVKSTSSTAEALLEFNSKAVHVLTMHETMRVWDPSRLLLRCYKVQATIEDSVRLFESGDLEMVGPRIGVPVQIPKCVKGQGCKHALAQFKTPESVWAETKYDGERMQIHIAVDKTGGTEITIFSKSKRDSTLDRIATHWHDLFLILIIREALGLRHSNLDEIVERAAPQKRRSVNVSSVILEAEMVAFDDKYAEFWRIRELVESTAVGARRKTGQVESRFSDSSDDACRHLALVFFDILYLNGRSLLSESYYSRRATLESVIRPIPKYAFLAHRTEIPLSGPQLCGQGLETLERIFSECIANYEEGLVLKASHATYNDYGCPWVKLKKDYIPGYGDAVDLVLVGASWEKERGRTLRVPPSTFTTFYVAVLRDSNQNGRPPHLEVLFMVSYGLDRRQLEQLNFLISSMSPLNYTEEQRWSELPFSFSLAKGLAKPKVILTSPLLVELFGAGFTKSCEGNSYELRFPRISKVYRAKDRNWQEGMVNDPLYLCCLTCKQV